MRRLVGIFACLIVLLYGATAWAGVAEKLGFRVRGNVQGKDQPKLVFTPTEDVKKLTVTLWRDPGNQKIHRPLGALKKAAPRELPVPQPEGKFHYKAKIEVTWAGGGDDVMRIQFDMTRGAGLALNIDPNEVDLDGRQLSFSLTAKGKQAELRLFDDDDRELGVVSKDLKGAAAGSKQQISWPEPKRELAYLKLRAWSDAGFWTETTLKPISLRIPHQDVVFDSGRATVNKSEEPKLKDTLAKLNEAVKMHAKTIGVRLYVAGYTDTVGDPALNRLLATQRARSIGAWFRRHGVKLPIFYQGFGEDVLAKETPDETDEPANRRALYLLSTHEPTDEGDFPKASWKKL